MTSMNELILYNYFRSSTSYRVRIALHHKNLPFEYKAVHLLNNGGEQHTSEYKKFNPLGEVPTLIHNSKIVAQSFAIIEYLDEIFPKTPLLQSASFTKAKVRQFCETINSFIHPINNLKVMQHLESKYSFTPSQKSDWISHWTRLGLQSIEKMLQEFAGDYSFGSAVSMADLFLVPQVFSAERFQVDLSEYPKLLAVNANCMKLEAFQKAHPFRQIDTPIELKIT